MSHLIKDQRYIICSKSKGIWQKWNSQCYY